MCGDPEALFLDEPTVGMDVETRRGVLESIRSLSSAGKTIVLTTHYLEEADQLAQRIVVIDHGVVIADATPREIKSRIPSKRINFSFDSEVGAATFQGLPVQISRSPTTACICSATSPRRYCERSSSAASSSVTSR